MCKDTHSHAHAHTHTRAYAQTRTHRRIRTGTCTRAQTLSTCAFCNFAVRPDGGSSTQVNSSTMVRSGTQVISSSTYSRSTSAQINSSTMVRSRTVVSRRVGLSAAKMQGDYIVVPPPSPSYITGGQRLHSYYCYSSVITLVIPLLSLFSSLLSSPAF